MQIVDVIQNTLPWLIWKKDRNSASEYPILEGKSPYKTKYELFLEKTGRFQPSNEDKSYIFNKGHETEALIREEFLKLTNVEMIPLCVAHKNYDYIIASLDGFDKNLGILEAKFTGKEVLKRAKEGDIPDHHYSQMQYQMFVTGIDQGVWFGHNGESEGVIVEVKHNKDYTNRILDTVEEFRRDIKEGRTPALTEKDYLIPENDELLHELRIAKEYAENAKLNFERLKEQVISTYKHSKISGAGLKLYKTTRQGTLNLLKVPEIEEIVNSTKETLKAEYLEQFRSAPTDSWVLKIDQKKG